jgi:hypothetical protein
MKKQFLSKMLVLVDRITVRLLHCSVLQEIVCWEFNCGTWVWVLRRESEEHLHYNYIGAMRAVGAF